MIHLRDNPLVLLGYFFVTWVMFRLNWPTATAMIILAIAVLARSSSQDI